MHARYSGTYLLPDGAKSQLSLGSPTDELIRTTGGGRLRFTLDRDGRPLTAALVRGDVEVWRAKRQP